MHMCLLLLCCPLTLSNYSSPPARAPVLFVVHRYFILTMPNPPPLLAVLQSITNSSTTLTLFWSPPTSNDGAPITSYFLEWDTVSSFNSVSGGPIGSESIPVGSGTPLPSAPYVWVFPSNPATPLVGGTTYFLRLRALNDQVTRARIYCVGPLYLCLSAPSSVIRLSLL